MRKVTIKEIFKNKGKKPIACLTAYSKPLAEILNKYCDIILVGDSVGMTLYGMKTTKEVKPRYRTLFVTLKADPEIKIGSKKLL